MADDADEMDEAYAQHSREIRDRQEAGQLEAFRDCWNGRLREVGINPSTADDLRGIGWAVATHNDYRQDGRNHTFWLLTKDGRALKGEGLTDADALNRIRVQVTEQALASESPPGATQSAQVPGG